MTHQEEATLPADLVQLLCDAEAGEGRFAMVLRVLLNEAMRLERAAALAAKPYERTVERTGYANGSKPKTLATRLGQLDLQVPQVRGGVAFYASALERGVRSERALKLAIAEMYVQGVSTRKVTQVLEQLCGGTVVRGNSCAGWTAAALRSVVARLCWMKNSSNGASDRWDRCCI